MRNDSCKKGIILLVIVAFVCIFAASCTRAEHILSEKSFEEKEVDRITEQVQAGNAGAVDIYGKVEAVNRQVSIIFEGFSDEATMLALTDLVKEYGITTIFFLPGSKAAEIPDVTKYIADNGIDIGNYGMTGEKQMEKNKTAKNVRQIYVTQQAISEAALWPPSYLRCNGTEYTDEILAIAKLCGLKAVVEPTYFLNHTSFKSEGDARNFIRKTSRGSIITIKIGQTLDETEVITKPNQNGRPADDIKPTITKSPDLLEQEASSVVDVARWLFEACEKEGYEIISLEALMKAGPRESAEDAAIQVPESLLAELDSSKYPLPVTEKPFGVQETEHVDYSHFDKTVFIGDSVTVALEDFVARMRVQVPAYMGTAQFLVSGGLSAANSLWQVTDESRHPEFNGERMAVEDAVALMDVDTVYIMLGLNDISLYTVETYLENYRTLINLIKSKSPDVMICVQSITPGNAIRVSNPSNQEIFEYNLKLVEFCYKYGYHFIDVAFALRDEEGYLPNNYCSDPDAMGFHFRSNACGVWVDYLCTHVPEK